MSRQHHYLKAETEYYQAVELGVKKFEIRKNDRGFKVGDMIRLEEVVNGVPTGRPFIMREITYIFSGGKYGLEEGYCIMNW